MPETRKRDPCQRQACDIQTCLQANKFQESMCAGVIKAMLQCCDKFRESQSRCCSGFLKTQTPSSSSSS